MEDPSVQTEQRTNWVLLGFQTWFGIGYLNPGPAGPAGHASKKKCLGVHLWWSTEHRQNIDVKGLMSRSRVIIDSHPGVDRTLSNPNPMEHWWCSFLIGLLDSYSVYSRMVIQIYSWVMHVGLSVYPLAGKLIPVRNGAILKKPECSIKWYKKHWEVRATCAMCISGPLPQHYADVKDPQVHHLEWRLFHQLSSSGGC